MFRKKKIDMELVGVGGYRTEFDVCGFNIRGPTWKKCRSLSTMSGKQCDKLKSAERLMELGQM